MLLCMLGHDSFFEGKHFLEPKLPVKLVLMLQRFFPNDRLVNFNDVPDKLRWGYYKNVVPSFPGVIKADFDGDGKDDYGLLLYNEPRGQAQILAAMSRGDSWEIETVYGYHDCDPSVAFIETAGPGTYESLAPEANLTEEERDRGLRGSYTSKMPGIVYALAERDATYFFRTGTGWIIIE